MLVLLAYLEAAFTATGKYPHMPHEEVIQFYTAPDGETLSVDTVGDGCFLVRRKTGQYKNEHLLGREYAGSDGIWKEVWSV